MAALIKTPTILLEQPTPSSMYPKLPPIKLEDDEPDIENENDYDTDLELEDRSTPIDDDVGTYYYKRACTELEVFPFTRILENLAQPLLDLRYQGIGPDGAKALADALINNTKVEFLNLEENGLDGEGGAVIGDMLRENIFISQVNLARNQIGTMGAIAIGEMLPVNSGVTHLNLSENKFRDTDAEYLAAGIERNERLLYLDLSKNDLCEEGAQHLGNALGLNNSIEFLNLSWNAIRRKGAVTICKGLMRNYCLTSLDISFNGMGYEGAFAMANALKVNKYLRELDISHNRIDWNAVTYIAKALKDNFTLEVLKIGHNPLTMTGCLDILESIYNDRSEVEYVGFDGIPVSRRIIYVAESINRYRDFAISHGGVSDCEDVFGKKLVSKEDPLKLMLRFLTDKGIRVVDLFRTFDKDKDQRVSREQFIQGLKKAQVPLETFEMIKVMEKLDQSDEGKISYSKLNIGMKQQKIKNKEEEAKLAARKKKERDDKKRLMNPDQPQISNSTGETPRTTTSMSLFSRRSSVMSLRASNKDFKGTSASMSKRSSFANINLREVIGSKNDSGPSTSRSLQSGLSLPKSITK